MAKGKPIEIQIRTRLEDIWANLCEKYSSKENDLKYGIRDEKIRNFLIRLSEIFKFIDEKEREKKPLIIKNILKLKFINACKAYKDQKKIEKRRIEFIKNFDKI